MSTTEKTLANDITRLRKEGSYKEFEAGYFRNVPDMTGYIYKFKCGALRPKAGVCRQAARGRVGPRTAQEAARHDYRVCMWLWRVCRRRDVGHVAYKAVYTFARVARRDSFDTSRRRLEF